MARLSRRFLLTSLAVVWDNLHMTETNTFYPGKEPRISATAASKVSAARALAGESLDEILAGLDRLPEIDRKMVEVRARTAQAIRGQIPLLYISGPPGIGKSEAVVSMLAEHSRREEADWRKKNRDEKLDDRRTYYNEDADILAFNPPFRIISGGSTFPIFFTRMYWASYIGETLFIDDPTTLTDKRIKSALQCASDPTNGRWVEYNAKVEIKGIPKRHGVPAYQFLGGLIISINQRRGERAMREIISSALMDRAIEVAFPWDRKQLVDYVNRKAFNESGLLGYLHRPPNPRNPDRGGLGFTGDDRAALVLLSEVQDFYLDHHLALNPSFRTVRQLLADRVRFPFAGVT
jgi:hypothetical protein